MHVWVNDAKSPQYIQIQTYCKKNLRQIFITSVNSKCE